MAFEDINWSNGMLISASHMQSIKKVNFYNLFFLLKKKYRFFYGIIDIDFDVSQLISGILKVNTIIAIMEDGSFIDYDICNVNNELLYIDLTLQNIDNNTETIIYLAVIKHDSFRQESRLYNINGVKSDNENSHVFTEHIDYCKVKPYLLLEGECNANMIFMPLFKVKKNNDTYMLQSFLYLHFNVNEDALFGRSVVSLLNALIIKISVIHLKIQEFRKEKYIDYELFNIIRAYDIIAYDIYEIKQEIINNGVNMYDLYCKLVNILRKSFVINGGAAIDVQKFNINNLHNSFNYIFVSLESVINTIFYSDVNVESFYKCDNGEFRTAYNINAIINDKVYIQCIYYTKFIESTTYIYEAINNMSICSASYINYIHSTRVTGLVRKIITDFVIIKNIIGIVNIDNAVIIEIAIDKMFFKANEELVIILPTDLASKFSFNIIYPNKDIL